MPMNTADQTKFTQWQEKFIIIFFRLIRTAGLYNDNNRLTQLSVSQFFDIMEKLLEDKLTIEISEGQIYVEEVRLHHRREIASLIHDTLDFLAERELGGFVFYSSFKDISFEEILLFIRLLIDSTQHKDPFLWLNKQMKDARISWVKTIKDDDSQSQKHKLELKEKARMNYAYAVHTLMEVSHKVSAQDQAGVRKAKRIIQNMVDIVLEDESVFLGLSAIKEHDDYTYTHSVNVAILAIALGNRIGLSHNSLAHLGICGIFHDLGKVAVPHEILNKPAKLNDEEWKVMRKHPVASVGHILKLQASHTLKSQVILAPFEHHLNLDLSGYPKTTFMKKISLFGKILKIADVYDALCSHRVYRPAQSPDVAIKLMSQNAGKKFDVVLLKMFATMMGIYPVGTLVHLDTGEIGLVTGYPANERSRKLPMVMLFKEDEQGRLIAGKQADLEKDLPKKNIIHTANPEELGIHPSEYII